MILIPKLFKDIENSMLRTAVGITVHFETLILKSFLI
jgi:hypothetical protein